MPTISALGTTVQVDLGDRIDPEEFAAAWSRCLAPEERDRSPAGTDVDVTGQTTMTSLTQVITHKLIDRRRGELLMLHAGAVCNPRTGVSFAYAAPGGTGKTTLSRLLGAEYGYLTDETVGIEPHSWRIHPYPKPLSLRTPQGGLPKRECGPDELGLLTPHPDPQLATLAILRRSSGHDAATVTRLDLFDAITMLVPETSSLSRLPRPLHLLAALEEAIDGIWLIEYAEAEQVLGWARERLGAP
jgi:hypothetical protein